MGFILVARDPNQDMDSIPCLDLGVQDVVRHIMDVTIFIYLLVLIVGFILLFWTYMK